MTAAVLAPAIPAAAAAGPIGWILLGTASVVLTGLAVVAAMNTAENEFEDKETDCVEHCPDATEAESEISRQQQDGHIKDTPQHRNRVKQGKPTSTFDGDAETADRLTQEAWKNGQQVPGRPNVREYDFGDRIGTGPQGGGQTKVRVHRATKDGRIHGHPSGPEM